MQLILELGQRRRGNKVPERDDEGRVGADHELPVQELGELGERLHAVLRAALWPGWPPGWEPPWCPPPPGPGHDGVPVEAGIPDPELSKGGELALAWRYWRAVASTALRRSAGFSWAIRPATSMLAARRFTPHSTGPGRVSSKSLTSNSMERSGEAKPPKLSR